MAQSSFESRTFRSRVLRSARSATRAGQVRHTGLVYLTTYIPLLLSLYSSHSSYIITEAIVLQESYSNKQIHSGAGSSAFKFPNIQYVDSTVDVSTQTPRLGLGSPAVPDVRKYHLPPISGFHVYNGQPLTQCANHHSQSTHLILYNTSESHRNQCIRRADYAMFRPRLCATVLKL